MEAPSTAPTSAPAPSAPAPSAPASTPAPSSTPSTPAKYGEVPKSRAQQLWAEVDAKAALKTPGEEATAGAPPVTAEEIPEARPPEQAAPVTEPSVADPNASPNEATLPPRLRDSLKGVTDPKVRAYLADSAHMRATLSKTGLPFAQLQQFISEAPEYLQTAPTVDVLKQIASTAEEAGTISQDYISGSQQGHERFSQALLKAGPVPFVQYVGFLFNNTDYMIRALKQNYGEALGAQVEQFRDNVIDQGVNAVVARMRAKAGEGGDFEVLSEVADELEKFVGLKERADARVAPRRADPRDLQIQALQSEKQRVIAQQQEAFRSNVFNQAGNTIDAEIRGLVAQKGSGFTQDAQAELVEAIGQKIYGELLNNKAVVGRINNLNATGRWDQAHEQQLVNFYVSAARRLLGVVATPALRRMAQLTGQGMAARQQRVAAQVARKDPGASGSPPAPRPAGPPKTANPKDIFDWYDKQAEAKAGGG